MGDWRLMDALLCFALEERVRRERSRIRKGSTVNSGSFFNQVLPCDKREEGI